jgi:NitT/TauT family transport system ATP-binding protein
VLTVQGVQKVYGSGPNRYHALDGIDISIKPGQFICLLGASGCGKTTLLNILAGFEPISGGQITLNGQPIVGPDKKRMMLFQDANEALFPWLTVEDNVAFGLRLTGLSKTDRMETAVRYLRMVGLFDHRKKLPSEISGGMRQRAQIARALAMDPEIILMDEPFGALDALTRRKMHLELLRIWEETRKTVVMVTHDIAEALTLADRIAVMQVGPRSRIGTVVEVDMTRPREPGERRFGELYHHIETLLGD